jgi:hypothetical protein
VFRHVEVPRHEFFPIQRRAGSGRSEIFGDSLIQPSPQRRRKFVIGVHFHGPCGKTELESSGN